MGILALAALAAGLAFLFVRERVKRRAAEAACADDARARAELFSSLAAAAAHEVRNPLNTLSLTFQFLERLVAREAGKLDGRAAIEKHLGAGGAEVEKIKRTMESFVELARPRPLSLVDVDLAAVVTHAVEVERARRNGAAASVELAVEAGPTPARVDPKEIEAAIEALVGNALDAVASKGAAAGSGAGATGTKRVEIMCVRGEDGAASIVVRDNGAGFTKSALDRAFEPYFSTKPDHAGLGLARARLIVEAHGGRLHATNRGVESGGAEVRIELPAGGSGGLAGPSAAGQTAPRAA